MESSKESAGPQTPFQLEMGLQAMNAAVTPLDHLTLPASPDRSSIRAESLSPASSSSSSITDLASRLGPSPSLSSAAAIQAAKDADAKSSALKALAGIGKVVSKSRQVDAEALQAIKLQRAKVKAEAGPGSVGSHRHTRTLSTESIPSLPELSGTSLPSMPASTAGPSAGGGAFSASTSASMMPPPPSRGHRRSHSGIPLSGGGGGGSGGGHLAGNNTNNNNNNNASTTTSVPPLSSPQSYSELVSGMGLADLLALQSAVDTEIQSQMSAAGLSHLGMGIGASPTGTHSPQSPAEVLFSAQYASAVLASQQQQLQQQLQQQQQQQQLQQQQQRQRAHSSSGSLAHSPIYGMSPKKGVVPPFSSTGSGGSGGSGGGGSGSNDLSYHHSRSRSIDTILLQRSSSPFTPDSGSSGGLTAAASSILSLGGGGSGLEGGFHVDLSSMEDCVGGPQPPPTARSLDIGAPQPPPAPSAAFTSTDFSFLGGSGSSLLAPEVDVAPSPFTISSSSPLGQPSLLQQHELEQQQHYATNEQKQQLPLLFGNLQLGSLDPWR